MIELINNKVLLYIYKNFFKTRSQFLKKLNRLKELIYLINASILKREKIPIQKNFIPCIVTS